LRDILVHYHLFKNAGSSVDRILSNHFDRHWSTIDASKPWEILDPDAFSAFILSNPALRAVSSHQARMPPHPLPGIRFHPVFFLRHPIDRVGSVYAFERNLPEGASPGADKARASGIADYVDWRMEEGDGGVICNFQACYLGWHSSDVNFSQVLDRARAQVEATRCIGLVDRFEESMRRIACELTPFFGEMEVRQPAVNRSPDRHAHQHARINEIREVLGERRYARLLRMNELDSELYEFASLRFGEYESK